MSVTADSGSARAPRRIQVVVATSVMLSFISFWRAAAIVLNDLASSAYYAGGIAEQAAGRSAPWFILGVMLFSYAVRAVYVESCAMFTRGGVYRVVKEAMGGTLAKLSVSALMFDYVLTGPISGVSAGQYIVGLAAQLVTYFGHPWQPDKDTINLIAGGIACLITIYFWWRNTRGIHESSDDALKIMKVTTVMVVMLIAWSALTVAMKPEARRLPPRPTPSNLTFNEDAVGWMPDLAPGKLVAISSKKPPAESDASPATESHVFKIAPNVGAWFGLIGILIAFGHSILAMSGEESLAQVNREIEYPKHKNLVRAGAVIFIYSLVFTSLVSFFAYAIIPDHVRSQYYDNLIGGISVYLVGPEPLKLAFQAFIVIVGFLILAGAVNTAIIGSNGVLNRLSEDGVLTDWFRAPHRRYGTTFRMINLVVALQLATILSSRGNVYTLGEAYAFGVIWSFAFKGLAMLVLRFKDRSPREWKVPFNIPLGRHTELPVGLALIALLMFAVAGINLITKEVATISGIAFTLVFYAMFWISELINERRRGQKPHVEMDQFRVTTQETIDTQAVAVRPGGVLCLVRDYNTLDHVRYALEAVDTARRSFVVATIRKLAGPDTGYEHLSESELFTDYEQLLFSKVVSIAEKTGRGVELLVVPSSDIFQAIALTAAQLQVSEIIAGISNVLLPDEQAKRVGQAWETVANKPDQPVVFKLIESSGKTFEYHLGVHSPSLTEADIQLIHSLWLELIREPGFESIHHRDIVSFALARFQDELSSSNRRAVLERLKPMP